MSKAKSKGPGRPRTRPVGAVPLAVRFSPKERAAINAVASRSGVSAAQWMRAVVLAAVEKAW